MVIKIEEYLISSLNRLPNVDETQIKDFIETIRPLLTNHTDLLKIDKWYRATNVAFKSSPMRFMNTAFVENLKKGNFDREEKHCNTIHFLQVLRDNKIEVLKDSDIYLYTMFDYLYNEGYMTEAEIVECNKRAVKVLADKGKTTDDLIALYKNSNVSAKRNFDWNAIEREVATNKKRWEELLDDIDESTVLQNIRDFEKRTNNNIRPTTRKQP